MKTLPSNKIQTNVKKNRLFTDFTDRSVITDQVVTLLGRSVTKSWKSKVWYWVFQASLGGILSTKMQIKQLKIRSHWRRFNRDSSNKEKIIINIFQFHKQRFKMIAFKWHRLEQYGNVTVRSLGNAHWSITKKVSMLFKSFHEQIFYYCTFSSIVIHSYQDYRMKVH